MKKNYFIILFLSISCVTYAQQIPNGNFEQWVYSTSDSAYEPTGWETSNLGFYGDTGVRRYKPAYSGNLACGLKTSYILNTFTAPAYLFSSFPFTSKPLKMEGYIKGNLAMDDTFTISVVFGKDTNIIGDGSIYVTQSLNTYTKFSIPIDFYGAGNPDSCTISIMNDGSEPGDTMTDMAIDNLTFTYPVNINITPYKAADNLHLYPNPATERLQIFCDDVYSSAVIFNSTGQLMMTFGNETSISVIDFNTGLYFLRLLDENNRVVANKSFIRN